MAFWLGEVWVRVGHQLAVFVWLWIKYFFSIAAIGLKLSSSDDLAKHYICFFFILLCFCRFYFLWGNNYYLHT